MDRQVHRWCDVFDSGEVFALLHSETRFDMNISFYYAWMTLMSNPNAIQCEFIPISRPLWESTLFIYVTSIRGKSNRLESL